MPHSTYEQPLPPERVDTPVPGRFHLVAVGGGALPAYAESETVFFPGDGGAARIEFERDSTGAPTSLVLRQEQTVRRAARRP